MELGDKNHTRVLTFTPSLSLALPSNELARRGSMTLWTPGLSVQLASTPALQRPADSSSHSVCTAVHAAVLRGRLHGLERTPRTACVSVEAGPESQAEVMTSDLSFVTSTRGLEAASVRLQQRGVREAPQCRWDVTPLGRNAAGT